MTLRDSLDAGRRPDLYGVRGWLLFLCIVLMVFLPLQMAMFVWGMFTVLNASSLEGVFALFFTLGVLSLGFVAGIILYRERPLGVRLAKIFFALLLVFGAMALIGNREEALTTLQQVLPAAAWLAYLYRSERVRNTYSAAKAEAVSDVFR